MYAIRKIARLELGSMFYSPVAWILLIVFWIQSSMSFIDRILHQLGRVFAGDYNYGNMTYFIFMDSEGVAWDAKVNLYLFIPLLTMGLLSRELQSGSIKLPLSSPIRVADIVIGKFLAVMIYAGLLMLAPVVLMLTSGLVIEYPDYSAVMSTVLGLYLLTCAFGAIGLFMSSLTPHQVVAAIATLAVLAILNFIGGVGQSIPVVNKVTYWLHIPNHILDLTNGLITTSQIIYFICIISIFVSFTILRLSAGQKFETCRRRVAKYAAVSISAITAGYIFSLPALTMYFDMTRVQSNSLTEASVDLIQKIKGDWSITTYANVLDPDASFGLPRFRNSHASLFDRYVRHNSKLEMEYVLYYGPSPNTALYLENPGQSDLELAKIFAEENGLDFDEILSTEQISEIVDLAPEKYRFIQDISWNGKSEFVRSFHDIGFFPGESEVSAALKRLLVGPKKIAYVTGHGERGMYDRGTSDYQISLTDVTNRKALINHGFDFIDTKLDTKLPGEIDILFIADPKQAYSNLEIGFINDFITHGGNVIIAGEPSARSGLNDVLALIGVSFKDGQIYEAQKDYLQSTVFARHAEGIFSEFAPASNKRDLPVFLNGAVGIDISGSDRFTVIPILNTSSRKTWVGQVGQEDIPGRERNDLATSSIALAVSLTRQVQGHEQRIFVIGDADFMSNSLQMNGGDNLDNYNRQFVTNLFRWISHGEYPLRTERVDAPDKNILIDMDGVTWLKGVFYGVIPSFLILLSGTILWRRRRR